VEPGDLTGIGEERLDALRCQLRRGLVVVGQAAVEERFYGRTARMFYVSAEQSPGGDPLPRDFNDFEVAARESAVAYESGKLWGFIRHARITEAQASQFWERMTELVAEFDRLPRSGGAMYGFAVGVYPTDYPALPSHDDKDAARPVTRS
jgi:hypothetical protein